jgi:hypothetical protein
MSITSPHLESTPSAAGSEKKEGRAVVIVIGAGKKEGRRRELLGRDVEAGGLCVVRLTARAVCAALFPTGTRLLCISHATHFEFDGHAPRQAVTEKFELRLEARRAA